MKHYDVFFIHDHVNNLNSSFRKCSCYSLTSPSLKVSGITEGWMKVIQGFNDTNNTRYDKHFDEENANTYFHL